MRKALFAFLLLAACIWAADFSIPFQKKAPVIDGQFAPGEWDCAVAFSGTARNMDARRTTVWLAYDKSTMYVGLQADTPPRGKLRSVPGGRNNSDSLELWFFPPQELRTIGSLKFGTFQIIVSSEDDIFAEHNNPGYGLATQKWKHGASIKSQVKDKVWTMEMAIPLKNMGITGNPEGDWKILACRNYGIAPAYQGPMTDAGGFMDPTTYSTCHLKKGCLAIQQLYADNARLPLRFRVTNTGTKAASAGIALKLSEGKELALDKKLEINPGQSEEVDFTKECNAEGGNCKVAVQANGWNRTFNWRPPEMPIWRNTESYQTLFCSFDAGLPNMLEYSSIENAEVKVKPPVEGEAATVPGPSATRKVLDLTNSKLNFPKNKLSSPGAISFWMRVKEPLKKGQSYRRFMGTTFTPNGYIFFQEQNQGGMLLGAQYFGPQNKSPKLVLLGRRPQPNDWMHISINFLPGIFEVYINGIRRALLQHKLDIDLSKVGALSLENASFADLAVYSRPLTAAEITSLSQGDKPVTGTVGWYQLTNTVYPATGWARVSFLFDYPRARCQVRIDGQPIMSANGYITADAASDDTRSGAWYNLAKDGANGVASMKVIGCTAIDEVLMNVDSAEYKLTEGAAFDGLPCAWYDQYGISWSASGVYDASGMTAAEKFNACLSPLDGQTFAIKSVTADAANSKAVVGIPATVNTPGRQVVLEYGSTPSMGSETPVAAGDTTVDVALPAAGAVQYFRLKAKAAQ